MDICLIELNAECCTMMTVSMETLFHIWN